jgi:hypothetical protein
VKRLSRRCILCLKSKCLVLIRPSILSNIVLQSETTIFLPGLRYVCDEHNVTQSDGFIVLTSVNTYARVEQSVYALLRTRDMTVSRYKEYGIPFDWLSDSGVVGKVCISSMHSNFDKIVLKKPCIFNSL